MNRITFSKLELLGLCAHPFTADAPQADESSSVDASVGNVYHGVFARVINHGMGTGPGHLIEDECKRQGVDPVKWAPHVQALDPIGGANKLAREHLTVRAEVAVAYDPATGKARELGKDLNRAYVLEPGEIAGTADLVWTETDPTNDEFTLVIRDHKSGFRSEDTVTPAAINPQLAALARAFSCVIDCDQVRVELSFPKSGKDEVVDAHTYSLFDLEEVGERLAALAKRPETNPEAVPGIHCSQKWCPIRATCKATEAAMESMVVAVDNAPAMPASDEWPTVVTSADQIVSPRHAAWILHRAKAVEAAIKIQIDACKRYADKCGPFPMGEGQQWGPIITQPNETIEGDLDQLREVLGAHLPPEAVKALIKAKVGKGDLGKAAKASAPPRKGAALEATILDALRAASLAKRDGVARVEYRVHDAPAAALEAKKAS